MGMYNVELPAGTVLGSTQIVGDHSQRNMSGCELWRANSSYSCIWRPSQVGNNQ